MHRMMSRDRARKTHSHAAGAAVLSWAVNAFASLFSWLEWPSKFSPFSWYLHDTPLINGRSTGQLWLLLAVVAAIGAATFLFVKRNIATEQAVVPEAAARRKKTKSVQPRAVQAWEIQAWAAS